MKKLANIAYLILFCLVMLLLPQIGRASNTSVNFVTNGGNVVAGYINNTNTSFSVSGSVGDYEEYSYAEISVNGKLFASLGSDQLEYELTQDISGIANRDDWLVEGINEARIDVFDELGDLLSSTTSASLEADFTDPTFLLDIDYDLSPETNVGWAKIGDELIFSIDASEDLSEIETYYRGEKLVWSEEAGKYVSVYIIEEGGKKVLEPDDLSVKVTDIAGNSSEEDFVGVIEKSIDPEMPLAIILSPKNESHLNSSKVKLDFTVSQDVANQVIILNGKVVGLDAKGYIDQVLKDGKYQLKIVLIDEAGNISTEVLNFSIDTVAPQIGYSGNEQIELTQGDQLEFSGKTDPNTEVELEIRSDVRIYKTISDVDGNWRILIDSDELDQGEHSVWVRIRDLFGNLVYEQIAKINILGKIVDQPIDESSKYADASSVPAVETGYSVAYVSDVTPVRYESRVVQSKVNKDELEGEEVARIGRTISSEDVRKSTNWTMWLIILGLIALSSLVAATSYYGYGHLVEAREKMGAKNDDGEVEVDTDTDGEVETIIRKVSEEEVGEDESDRNVRW